MKEFFKKLWYGWENNKEKDMSSKSAVTPISANSSGTIAVSSPSVGYTYPMCMPPGGYTYPMSITSGYPVSTGTTCVTSGPIYSGGVGGYSGMAGTWAPGGFFAPNPLCITFNNAAGKSIVNVYNDGTIEWGENVNIDEAAKAFARSIHLGMEQAAGIKEATKLRIRNNVFEELIDIAKEKGSLTHEELTYLLQASKIMEKLKGIE